VITILVRLIDAYSVIVILSAVMSWIPGASRNPLGRALNAMTRPVYSVIHRVLDPARTGGIDLSPIIVLMVLQFIKRALIGM